MSSIKLFQLVVKIKTTLQAALTGTISHLPVNKYNQREHALHIFVDKQLVDLKLFICCVTCVLFGFVCGVGLTDPVARLYEDAAVTRSLPFLRT